MAADTDKQSFWEHLDVLRAAIVKSLLVAVVFGVAAFCFKEELFAVILAPKDADFITYRLLYSLGGLVTESGAPDFLVKLINTGLAGQFIIHMKAALCAGVLCASPYILYQLFRFVSPALYVNERKYVVRVVGGGYAMFALGVAVSYFLIFPLTFRFLETYQVSSEVENMIALQSYISTLMTMSLAMGLVFEIPILSWLFAKLGFLSADFLIIQRDIKIKARNRKRLEETIEQNNALLEMRKNIILTISHDIRAPLNIISGSAELATDTREKKRRNNHLDNIRIVCKHVVHLLNNLLDVYRLNEAKEIRNDVPFSLKDLLERTVFGFSHVINNKGVLFCHDFKDTDVKLYGDVDRIAEQIIDNLLSNAVKVYRSRYNQF